MPEKDYVEQTLDVKHKGIFDLDGLYKTLARWFRMYKYDLVELDYKDFKEEGKNMLFIKWQAPRMVSDYIKYVIEAELNVNNYREVIVEKKKNMDGELDIKFSGYLLKDYEETWSRRGFMKFIREVYDKFLFGSKLGAMEKELKDELYKLVNEVKSYLNLVKVKE